MTRDQQLINLRPLINTIDPVLISSKEEKFQNEILRPVIKFQHELILLSFDASINKRKIDLASFSKEKKELTITELFKNDRGFIEELKGIVIGHFTSEEYKNYLLMKSEINKRIVQIVRERVISVVVK